jgi:hypothetical protein
MPNDASLDPDTRCWALIGQFLQRWAALESAMHLCIQTTFKLSPTATQIICANMKVQDKLNVLRTVVSLVPFPLEQTRAKNVSMLRRVGRVAGRRNMIAHTPFRPYQKGAGVEFLHIEAKGTYDSTGVIWPEQIFKREFDSICILQAKMAWLNALLKEHPIRDEAYLAGLETALMMRQPTLDYSMHTMTHTLRGWRRAPLRDIRGGVMPSETASCWHNLEAYLDAYIEAAGICDGGKTPLFRSAVGRTGTLTATAMNRVDAWRMIQRRAAELGTRARIGCHTFRATGITAYLEAGGTLENAQAMAAHESPRTTKLYDRTSDEITLDEVERITI